ncbi:MAG: murein L,D-transpeptidase catalytic domain family protein [Acidobacteriaceae bacterium]|nr:murein L,D-transpeptidase catalytic domain family protein [Acidobacteriaceae bacterium]
MLRTALLGVGLSLVASLSLSGQASTDMASAPTKTALDPTSPELTLSADAWNNTPLGSLDSRVFELALNAASCAVQSGDIAEPQTLTVIDYSRPSTEARMWVFDLQTHELLYNELVAHGEGSGGNLPTRFSNDDNSHRSSLGLFSTGETYNGKNGYSLRLNGLDAGFNDHAMERAIVIHGATYVNETVAKKQGRLGRSWGCPALREGIAHEVIDHVKGSGLVFAYYPDARWLATSKYLGQCHA